MRMTRIAFLLALVHLLCAMKLGVCQPNDDSEDEACLAVPLNKKVNKLYQNAKDRGKSYKEQTKLLRDALEIDDQCGACLWEIAKKNFLKAKIQIGNRPQLL